MLRHDMVGWKMRMSDFTSFLKLATSHTRKTGKVKKSDKSWFSNGASLRLECVRCMYIQMYVGVYCQSWQQSMYRQEGLYER